MTDDKKNVNWTSAVRTNLGNVRKVNEDSVLVHATENLWVVADGMGGHDAGDVASKLITDALAKLTLGDSFSDNIDLLEDTLLHVNQQLRDYSKQKFTGRTVGSTVVLMYAQQGFGACMWAGDSRLYRWRPNGFEQLTSDHSQVAALVESGLIESEEAVDHPASNIITRAVGAADTLQLDVRAIEVELGDVYLLCSDGLYNEVDSATIERELTGDTLEQSADQMIADCLAGNAQDNVSLIIIKPEIA
ncbi:MAG: PP2C family protein-serine/threonine phosphatase [Pseudomonadales bacterium]